MTVGKDLGVHQRPRRWRPRCTRELQADLPARRRRIGPEVRGQNPHRRLRRGGQRPPSLPKLGHELDPPVEQLLPLLQQPHVLAAGGRDGGPQLRSPRHALHLLSR